MAIPGGFLIAKNDSQFLYAALDMIDDTGSDAGTVDYFWFTFDKNLDASMKPPLILVNVIYPIPQTS